MDEVERKRLGDLERELIADDPMLDQRLRSGRRTAPSRRRLDPVPLGLVALIAVPLVVAAALLFGTVVAAVVGGVALLVAVVLLVRGRRTRASGDLPPPPAYR